MNPKNLQRFILLAQLTLVFVYIVIIAGSVVRATGSGMGCPDWPKCFGKWVPPTDVSQLPENYKELYAGEHHAVAEFNALNTWTEYINRLAGAMLGLLIFAQLLFSVKTRQWDKKFFTLSLIEFVLIGFQGWLGAKVVSSNLAPVKITVHMVVALIILCIAIAIVWRAKKTVEQTGFNIVPVGIKRLSILVFAFTITQIMLGTQVREEVDLLLKNFDPSFRAEVVNNLGTGFYIHRSFSILILIVNIFLVWKILKSDLPGPFKKTGKYFLGILILEFFAGVTLSNFALPAFVQPLHLLLACMVFGLQFWLILQVQERSST